MTAQRTRVVYVHSPGQVAEGSAVTEGPGRLWRHFDVHGPLLFLFDVKEVLLHTHGLDCKLLEPSQAPPGRTDP